MNWSQSASRTMGAHSDIRQSSGAWRIIIAWSLQSFAINVGTQMMVHFLSFHYMLDEAAISSIYNLLFAVIGGGQLIIALLSDRYMGWLRMVRLGLMLSCLSLLSFTLIMSAHKEALIYKGQEYEVTSLNYRADISQYVHVDNKMIEMKVMADGRLTLKGAHDTVLPAVIDAGDWQLSSSLHAGTNILLLIVIALYLASRCFGFTIVFGLLGAVYQKRDSARVVGFALAYIGMNLMIFLARNMQITLMDDLGRKGILALACLASVAAYCILRFDRGQISEQAGMMQPVGRPLPQHAHKIFFTICLLIALTVMSVVLHVSSGASMAAGYWNFIPSVNQTSFALFYLFVAAVLFFLWQSYRSGQRENLYAMLCIVVLSILRLIFDCMLNIGAENTAQFGLNYINLTQWKAIGLIESHLALINSASIAFLGGLYLALWWQVRRSFAPMNELIKCFIAFSMVGSGYLILSIGTHDLDAQQLVPFSYYAVGAVLVSLAELLITPSLMATVYRLRADYMPSTTLVLFAMFLPFSRIVSAYYADVTGMKRVEAIPDNMAATQVEFGNAFLNSGTLGLMGAMLILFALLPLFTRWMQQAESPQRARREQQFTGFDHHRD